MANHIGPHHSSPSSSPPPQGVLTSIFLLNQGRDKVEEGVGVAPNSGEFCWGPSGCSTVDVLG